MAEPVTTIVCVGGSLHGDTRQVPADAPNGWTYRDVTHAELYVLRSRRWVDAKVKPAMLWENAALIHEAVTGEAAEMHLLDALLIRWHREGISKPITPTAAANGHRDTTPEPEPEVVAYVAECLGCAMDEPAASTTYDTAADRQRFITLHNEATGHRFTTHEVVTGSPSREDTA